MSMAFRKFCEDQGIPAHSVTPDMVRDFTQVRCRDDRTKQADKDACDVNLIVRKNIEAGVLPQARQVPSFGDATLVRDLQDALAIADGARDAFMKLTAQQREAFGNDPLKFVMAASTPGNEELFRSVGLLPPTKEAPAAAGASSTVGT